MEFSADTFADLVIRNAFYLVFYEDLPATSLCPLSFALSHSLWVFHLPTLSRTRTRTRIRTRNRPCPCPALYLSQRQMICYSNETARPSILLTVARGHHVLPSSWTCVNNRRAITPSRCTSVRPVNVSYTYCAEDGAYGGDIGRGICVGMGVGMGMGIGVPARCA